MKKIFAIVLAMMLVLSMAAAFAAGTGEITVYNSSVGKNYTLVKVFDATYEGTNVSYTYTGTVTDDMQAGPFTFTQVGTTGTWVVTKDAGATDEAIITWVTANAETIGTQVGSPVAGTGTAIEFTGLDFGYYYITTGTGSVVTIDSAVPSATVRDKNITEPTKPEDEENLKVVDDTQVAVGDTAKYTISFTAVNYKTTATETKKIEQYTVVDTPTNIDIDEATITVKVGDKTLNKADGEFTTKEENGVVTITIPWVDSTDAKAHLYASPIDVEIKYDAVVLDGIATSNAKNSVTVTDGQGTTLTDEDPLTTASFKVFKYTKNGEEEVKLDGAQFKLYDAATGGNQIYVNKVDGVYYVTTTANETLIDAGEVVIKGLDEGDTYYLEEVTTPLGYNKLTSRQAVTVTTTTETETVDGQEVTTEVITVAKVLNQTGTALPQTGGIGTTIFYVVGGLLMAAAVVLLVTNKKMSAAK